MKMQHYIRKNRGVLAVIMDCEAILEEFEFNETTLDLKKAVESSIEKRIATDIVDELLKSSDAVILNMYHILHKTDQPNVAIYFCEECPESNSIYDHYTKVKECSEGIPCDAKLHSCFNKLIDAITLCNHDKFVKFICVLQDKCVISSWHSNRICHLDRQNRTKEAFTLLFKQIINKYQYDQLNVYMQTYYPTVLKYL